jgi:hypothetical protein
VFGLNGMIARQPMKTTDSFGLMPAASGLLHTPLDALHRDGFAIVPGPIAREEVQTLADTYDKAMREADPSDTRNGSTTIRVDDLVNRGREFDCIYIHPPLLDACWRVFMQPFKLSTMLARTLRPGSPPQKLYQDFPRDEAGWTMVGFILMVDEFRVDNGVTCFLPGSHQRPNAEVDDVARSGAVPACGPAGSMIVYNGSVWHGHGANGTLSTRRSIQGAFIRRDLTSGFDLASRMRSETLLRIGPVARYLILAEPDV